MNTPPPFDVNSYSSSMRARLRPMGFGDILDEALALYRQNFVLFVATVALVQIPVLIITIVLSLAFIASSLAHLVTVIQNATQTQDFSQVGGVIATAVVYALVLLIVNAIAATLQGAALVLIISNRFLDRTLKIGDAYKAAFTRLGALLIAQVWIFVRFVIALVVNAVILGVIAAILHSAAIQLILILASVCLYIYFGIAWIVTTQAIILDGTGGFAATGRSRMLVRGFWWKALGLALLLGIINLILTRLSNSIGGADARGIILSSIITSIVGILFTPVQTTVYTLLFYDLKIRKEAFDLEALAQQTSMVESGYAPTSPEFS